MRQAYALAMFFALPKWVLAAAGQDAAPPLPAEARPELEEHWADGKIDPAKWYVPRNKWGNGTHGVVPENVRVAKDVVDGGGGGRERDVLVCEAHGDAYDGPVIGFGGRRTRVGGVIVSKAFFASGRFEVVMKVGSERGHEGGPADPVRPKGAVPAIWTYAYRFISVPKPRMDQFVPESPLYNPLMKRYGIGANEYWSELDFPEYGKGGQFDRAMYNTFCQNMHEPKLFDVSMAVDGLYHTYTTQWRTRLAPLEGVGDAQVVKHEGHWWVKDKAVPFEKYLGNPLKRIAADRYAVYAGERADHWIDGRKVAENTKYVPAMAAQLTMGVWLPDWAGPAKWKTARVSVASVRVWQFGDEGDVRGVLTRDLKDNFDPEGRPLR
jgi:hypothetical protein